MTATAHADAPSIAPSAAPSTSPRHDWTMQEARALFELPFNDLVFRAQSVHREHFDPNEVQISTLLSIKTGGCPETCNYCAQSSSWKETTELKAERLMAMDDVLNAARRAKEAGSTRFCMGTAWRGRVLYHTGSHTTAFARCTPILEDFSTRRRLSPSLSVVQ